MSCCMYRMSLDLRSHFLSLLLAKKQNTGNYFLGSLCNFEASDELYLIGLKKMVIW